MAKQAQKTAQQGIAQARQRVSDAKHGLANKFRSSDPSKEASLKSSSRAGPAFSDAWQRAKRP
jgi:hypothetical protein